MKTDNKTPLYNKKAAEFLQKMEKYWVEDNQMKYSLLLDNIGKCERLVDIGCGWGQFLAITRDYVSEIWCVDESPYRVKDIKRVCPEAKIIISKADNLELSSNYFDVAVTSQMLHEVKLFGQENDLKKVLKEIYRILSRGGRYLLLDHLDAGDGYVTVELPNKKIKELSNFKKKFRFYRATYEAISSNIIRISKRCLQDFLTKDWSLNSPMESIEMNETHNVFQREETMRIVKAAGFKVSKWIPFSDTRRDLEKVGGELLDGETWFRKFLLVAIKP